MRKILFRFLSLTILSLVTIAQSHCSKKAAETPDLLEAAPTAPTTPAPPPEAMAKATQIFTQRCVTCHGADGSGNGPAATALNPKPRSFKDAEWQKSITDDHVNKIIVQGGGAVGKSNLMPPNPDLANDATAVSALTYKVREFAK